MDYRPRRSRWLLMCSVLALFGLSLAVPQVWKEISSRGQQDKKAKMTKRTFWLGQRDDSAQSQLASVTPAKNPNQTVKPTLVAKHAGAGTASSQAVASVVEPPAASLPVVDSTAMKSAVLQAIAKAAPPMPPAPSELVAREADLPKLPAMLPGVFGTLGTSFSEQVALARGASLTQAYVRVPSMELTIGDAQPPALDPSMQISPMKPAPELALSLPRGVDTDLAPLPPLTGAEKPGVQDHGSETMKIGDLSPGTKPNTQVVEPWMVVPAISNGRGWPVPTALIGQLEELAEIPASRGWALGVLSRLDSLLRLDSMHAEGTAGVLHELQVAHDAYKPLIHGADNDLRKQVSRTAYSLSRRLDVWQAIHEAPEHSPAARDLDGQLADLAEDLEIIHALLSSGAESPKWRKYLDLENLQKLATEKFSNEQRVTAAAKRVLARMDAPKLTREQKTYLSAEPFVRMQRRLLAIVAPPVDLRKMLLELEELELTSSHQSAQSLAQQLLALELSADDASTAIGQRVGLHYRNANLRVSVSAQLINRLIPPISATEEPVSEYVVGARVVGSVRTSTRLQMRLLPDANRLKFGFEANGVGVSSTSAVKGGVTLYTTGESTFEARKLVVLDRNGLRHWASEGRAANSTTLTGVESNLDFVPIFGSLIRSVARNQHDSVSAEADQEVIARTSAIAAERLDRELSPRLAEANDRFQKRVVQPLSSLGLEPTPIGLQTTEERLIVRARLASSRQMAASTARPLATSDALISAQLHESVINNLFGQFALEGNTFELRDLLEQLTSKLGLPSLGKNMDDLPEDIKIKFAAEDAVRVKFENGAASITLKIALLEAGENTWRNIVVNTYYVPDFESRTADLVREDIIELEGTRLKLRDQIALRGIFSKVFSKNRPMHLLPGQLVADPRVSDCQVTQFDIENGWIGVAFGPSRGPVDRTAIRSQQTKASR